MDRFTKDQIALLSLIFVGATVVWYLIVAWRARDILKTNAADEFLRYRGDKSDEGGVSADMLNASLMGSAFSLASAVYVYLNWAATDGAFALWSPIAWACGAGILYYFRARIFRESRNSWTLHTFLQDKYSNDTLKRLASVVTSIVFLLQVAAEVFVGLSVLQVFVGAYLPLWALVILTGAIFIFYSAVGGFPAVMITDAIKYRLIVFALLVAALFLLDNGGASAFPRFIASLKETFIPGSIASWIVLVSLFALNLPIFITDMSVWQRVGSASNASEVTNGLGRFACFLLPWMTGIIFVGVGFGSDLVPPAGWTNAQAILAFFSDSMVFPFLLAGLFAALLTTADSFLIAAAQTVVVDWLFAKDLAKANYDPQKLSIDQQTQMVRLSRIAIVVLGIGAVLTGYFLLQAIPSLLDLLFVIFGMQTALAPTVIWALLGRAKAEDAEAGIASIVAGGAIALLCLILALLGVSPANVSIGLWSPILVLLSSSIVFFALHRLRSPAIQ